MQVNDTNFEEANVIESHPAGPPESKVIDAFAISKEFRESLLEYFAAKPLGDSDVEKVWVLYQGVKNAQEMKVTITPNAI